MVLQKPLTFHKLGEVGGGFSFKCTRYCTYL